jgi:hypothetical protein
MITITSANQIRLNSGACVEATVSDRDLAIKALVGYHNYAQTSVKDAQDIVQGCIEMAGLSAGWRAECPFDREVPANAVRVGQVRVHPGDSEYPLLVVRGLFA